MSVAIAGNQYLWPEGRIPYAIDPAVPQPERVEAAIRHWNERTVVRFEPHAGETDYVLVTRLPGYSISDVGHRGGQQWIKIGDGCTTGEIIHELGHTVGLWHEHCRHDRDLFVAIDFTNIQYDAKDQFLIDVVAGQAAATGNVGAYDYGSVMHYGLEDFAIDDTSPVIAILGQVPAGVTVGQRDGLSDGDIAAVAQLYGAGAAPPLTAIPSAT